MIDIADAVESLRPGAGFVMYGDELSGLTFITPNVEPITQAEIDAEMVRLEAAAEAQAEADAAATAAAIAHAKSLGFTDAMIAVMYPNLGAPNV
jgi:hypothetical protein